MRSLRSPTGNRRTTLRYSRFLCLVVGSLVLSGATRALIASDTGIRGGEEAVVIFGSAIHTSTHTKEAETTVDHQQLMAEDTTSTIRSSRNIEPGQAIYKTRCVLCHGEYGHGDGLMSKVITDPPPSDLTRSTIDKLDLMSIIINGGATMDRSPQMPPWGDEIADDKLESLIEYLLTLRVSGA